MDSQPETGEAGSPAKTATVATDLDGIEPPRGSFMKGFIIGCAIYVPALAGIVWLFLPEAMQIKLPIENVLFLAATFAGIPAAITAGGVARAAANAVVRWPDRPRAPVEVAALNLALASVALIWLAAIPVGGIPEEWPELLALGSYGALVGFAVGAIIGFWAGRRS